CPRRVADRDGAISRLESRCQRGARGQRRMGVSTSTAALARPTLTVILRPRATAATIVAAAAAARAIRIQRGRTIAPLPETARRRPTGGVGRPTRRLRPTATADGGILQPAR